MTLLNISLCLPELDIIALRKKHSIVAVTQRFIAPDRSFTLLPCRTDSAMHSAYHPQVLGDLKSEILPDSESKYAANWARCVFCQQVDEGAIATLSNLTIWTSDALSERLQNGSLFLSFLRTYALPNPIAIESEPVCEQIYKFIPLSHYLEVRAESPIYSDEEFATAKQEVLEPKESEPEWLPSDDTEEETDEPRSILDAPDWIEKISEVGNSSNGYNFEKLVRKGLMLLGFTNSLNQATASLDPNATGGAGGIDFYADHPYSIMGECKATSKDKVGTPAKQLYKLGVQWLGREVYENSIKLVVAGGKATPQDEQFAKNSEINVVCPTTFQMLIELKVQYEELFKPLDLKAVLEKAPFGKNADRKLVLELQKWKDIVEAQEAADLELAKEQQRGRQVVQTVKELSEQSIHQERNGFSVVEVRSHYNAKYQPCLKDEDIENLLIALSAALSAGCLGRYQSPDQNRYDFKKDMP